MSCFVNFFIFLTIDIGEHSKLDYGSYFKFQSLFSSRRKLGAIHLKKKLSNKT